MSALPVASPDLLPRVVAAAHSDARWNALVVVLALGGAAVLWWALPLLAAPARGALIAFALAIVGWTVLRLPEMPVTVAAAGALVLAGITPAPQFFDSLGDPLIWLLIGAFVLSAVVRHSGLAERFVLQAVAGASTMRRLFYRLTWAIAATAFVVPSTSGRAALLLPVFLCLAGALSEARVVRALALLFPSVILLSACASLLGAGAHLIAVDVISALGLPAPGFVDWALLGGPVALGTCAAATELILRLFLSRDERARVPHLPAAPREPLSARQRTVLAIVLITIVAWATTGWHGVEPALVALGGALAATARALTGVAMKDALKAVEWSLILFIAATLTLGEALLTTGAAEWLAAQAVVLLPPAASQQPAWLVSAVAAIAMLSHLLITSRSARAAVLIPTLALPLAVLPEQAAVLVMVVTIASGFCQTLMVSAKPVALYARACGDQPTFGDADLARLSLALMPAFALVLLACVFGVWPQLGVSMRVPSGGALPWE